MSNGPDSDILLVIAISAGLLKFLIVLMTTAIESVSRKAIRDLAEKAQTDQVVNLMSLISKPSRYRYANSFLSYLLFATGVVCIFLTEAPNWYGTVVYVGLCAVFTELFPRKIGRQHAQSLSLKFAGIQTFVCIITYPIIFLLLLLTNLFLRLFRQDTKTDDDVFSEEQVLAMLDLGQESGVIKEEGKKMINSIFQFDDLLAYEIMTPRTDVFLIDLNDNPSEYINQLMELRYSRIPVCEGETDNIIGILNIKDFLIKAWQLGFDKVPIREILRKPYFIPETKNIDSLFVELQKERQHIAILIDEYGGFSGIVTMEDIIEEVMGDIDDEYDKDEEDIKKINDNTYIIDGNAYLDDINEAVGTELSSESSETLGGFIIDAVGEIPHEGKGNFSIFVEDTGIEILSVRDRRIGKVRLRKGIR